jgi:hypothetical protein
MRTSKAYFNRFKKEFLRWQKELGLTQYSIAFYHEKLEKGEYAKISINENGKTADVFLNTELDGRTLEADEGPESNAKHEAIHLLLNRLCWLGDSRYIESSAITEEWEALVVRLEKVLK